MSDLTELFKDKVMLWILRISGIIAVIVLCLISIPFIANIYKGKHEKLFGVEWNIPPVKTDTVKIITAAQPIHDTTVKLIPFASNKERASAKSNIKERPIVINAKNAVGGNNSGNVGDIYNGIVNQRHLSTNDIKLIQAEIPDTNTVIQIVMIAPDGEALKFANEIEAVLNNMGYKSTGLGTGAVSGKSQMGKVVINKPQHGNASLFVYPLDNTAK